MGERSSYEHGTFSWVDHASPDPEAAKRFYAAVFDWDYDDRPVGEGVVYSMALRDGKAVAAIGPQVQAERERDVPAHWNNYVTVRDLDDVSSRVEALGGRLEAPPFEVMDAGRMAVVLDPGGAHLCLWEARANPGAALVNAPGALCWNEVATRDPEAAQRFYSGLLGWSFAEIAGIPDMRYWTILNGERANGGMRLLGDEVPAETPPHWLAYFAVEEVETSARKAADAGGQVLVPKTGANEGNWFAVIADPAGAVFAIFEGRLDD